MLAADEDGYQLGRGYHISEALTVGGYFSAEYKKSDTEDYLTLEDLAVLGYGKLSDKLSYLVELESVDFYKVDFEADTDRANTKPAVERLYVDYDYADVASFRIGKQLTPVGFWSRQPINVLRETTSSPLLTSQMFPRFLSGIDANGFLPFDESISYHLYMQANGDIDDRYVNIDVDKHFGISLEKELFEGVQLGGSVGWFEEANEDTTRYGAISARYKKGATTVTSEAVWVSSDRLALPAADASAVYLQWEYGFAPKHTIVSRVEYLDDNRVNDQARIGVIGYSFRPVYPVSLKAEFQADADSNNDLFLTSLSVLF
ncbi:hypothetical protein [Alcanivorax sp. 1008]|uniref:hypothetical protein n=1 Tax=Alcanivorax sp. 1008 TaxID=2816853 RepID=UPI001D44FE5B|nr:hypothetical protein [Alcanivorax sp. 1008]MCC1498345.1 hypothetical protein [Alcanivorax sp. 1008]